MRIDNLNRQRPVVDAFLAAVRSGDFDALIAVLDPDVVLRSDCGPRASREIRGARAVAEEAKSFSRLAEYVQPVLVNGTAGIVSWLPGGRPFSVMGFTVDHGKIVEIDTFTNFEQIEYLLPKSRLNVFAIKRTSKATSGRFLIFHVDFSSHRLLQSFLKKL